MTNTASTNHRWLSEAELWTRLQPFDHHLARHVPFDSTAGAR